MPSIGIYSYELFKFYDVENIIRIGSCGAYSDKLNLYDVLLVQDAWSESTYAKVQSGYLESTIEADKELNNQLATFAAELDIPLTRVRIHSSDVFYREKFEDYEKIRDEEGCMAVEMESFALFANAKVLGKKAACLLTVSDSLVKGEATTSEERQNAFTKMMEIALEMAK
jgi:purine-nucleoside phosphorylase